MAEVTQRQLAMAVYQLKEILDSELGAEMKVMAAQGVIAAVDIGDPLPVGQSGQCRRCGRTVRWLRTARGRPMPVEIARRVVTTEEGTTHSGFEAHMAYCSGRA